MLGISPMLIHSKNEFLSEEFLPPLPIKEDEIWELIRKQYELHPDFINLESGYYNIIPKSTMDKHLQHIKRVNLEGAYYMRNHRFDDKASITAKLSDKVGCYPSELIITRNTTESLDLVIAGFPWKAKIGRAHV